MYRAALRAAQPAAGCAWLCAVRAGAAAVSYTHLKANGVPLYFGLIPALLSTFLHLMLMSAVIYLAAPPAFGAAAPADPAAYFGALAVFTAASLSVGGVLEMCIRDRACSVAPLFNLHCVRIVYFLCMLK